MTSVNTPEDDVRQKLRTQILPYFVFRKALRWQPDVLLAGVYKWSQLIFAAAAAAGMSWGVYTSAIAPPTPPTTPPAATGSGTSGAVPSTTSTTGQRGADTAATAAAGVGAGSALVVFLISLLRDIVQNEEKQRLVVNKRANGLRLRGLQTKLYHTMGEHDPWPGIREVQAEIQKMVNLNDGSWPFDMPPPRWVETEVDVLIEGFMKVRPIPAAVTSTPGAPAEEPQQRLPPQLDVSMR
jgi:hypothetical protein